MSVSHALVDKYQFTPGTIACICYDNSDHLLILSLAIISAGGTVACVYPKDPYAELLYLARKVEPKYLFCHERNCQLWADQLSVDLNQRVRGISMGDPESEFDTLLLNYNYAHSNEHSANRIPINLVENNNVNDLKHHVALISMSSGTSGRPKAVAQTHWNVLADLFANPRKSAQGLSFACCASLDYVSGRIIMFGSLHLGYQTILLNGFEPASYLEALARYKVRIIYIGAAAFYNLITYKHLDRYDLSSLRCVFPMGAKIIYLDELRKFFAKNPQIIQVRQGYGTSEFSGGAMNSFTPEEYLKDCDNCGRLLPGMRAKIIDPQSGRQMGVNELGIVHMRGETVFPGYYDMEFMRQNRKSSPFVRAHGEVFDAEGYYITGDWAYFNEHEELYIVGRQKEMMCCRGAKKVLPAELEQVLEEHPAVAKVCVLGVANKLELTLHCPRAFVVPRGEYYTNEEEYNNEEEENYKMSPSQPRLSTTLNEELDGGELAKEKLTYSGVSKLCKLLEPEARRHQLLEELMKFVNERVGWEKQLTGGLALLDDIPTSRATGKFNKNFLRSLTTDQVEFYGDRSAGAKIS